MRGCPARVAVPLPLRPAARQHRPLLPRGRGSCFFSPWSARPIAVGTPRPLILRLYGVPRGGLWPPALPPAWWRFIGGQAPRARWWVLDLAARL